MPQTFVATAVSVINVSPAKVWEALTQPALIKQYMFGTDVSTDWQVGSPITYTGEWEGKPYHDKGRVVQVEPERLLVSTYWSAFSGLPDLPENYQTVRYTLTPENGGTRVTLTQDNNLTQESATHSEQNWTMVLAGLKKLLES